MSEHDDQAQQPPRRSRLEQADKALGVAYGVLVLLVAVDAVTHGRLRMYGRAMLTRARHRISPPQLEPSPQDVTEMHRQARAILENGGGGS